LVQQRGVAHQFRIASCGTGSWHVGKGADPRTMLVAAQHGLSFEHTARQVDADADVHEFDLFVAMDNRNKSDLIDLGIPRNRVRLLRSFDPACGALPEHTLDVPDPYYGGQEGFETMYQMIAASSEGLLSAALKGELPSRVAR
jgi:protein-tyrosine phosphatase